jgi:predicted amidophosphoribosyltransferase
MRRYNQAALLAQAVGRLAGVKFGPDLLVRRKRTPSLAHSGASARAKIVSGAFVVPPKRRQQAEGRRIVIIDDVFTTGSTISACARALTRSGARAIDVLTLARVVRPSHLTYTSSSQLSPTNEENDL